MPVRVLAVVEANYKQMHPLLVSFVLILACISEKSNQGIKFNPLMGVARHLKSHQLPTNPKI